MRLIQLGSSVAVLIVASFVFVAGCRHSLDEPKDFTPDDFKKVANGMAETDLKALLGNPKESLETMGNRYLFWKIGEKIYNVTCDDDGKVTDSKGPLTQAEQDDLKSLVVELKALEGTWDATSMEVDGKKSPVDMVEGLRYQFLVKDRVLVRTNKKDLKATALRYKLDHKKSPKEVTFPADEHLAIYEVKGGELKICIQAHKAKGRPTEFGTKEASGLTLVVFRKLEANK